jgi:hypothetical protein
LAAGLGSAFVLGLYFIFAITVLWRQTGHGFASLRIEGYKGFLRLRIAEDASLTMPTIGLKHVPKDAAKRSRASRFATDRPVSLRVHLRSTQRQADADGGERAEGTLQELEGGARGHF